MLTLRHTYDLNMHSSPSMPSGTFVAVVCMVTKVCEFDYRGVDVKRIKSLLIINVVSDLVNIACKVCSMS
jgi:hypothetical protein